MCYLPPWSHTLCREGLYYASKGLSGRNTPSYSILINYLWSSQQLQNVSGFDDENGDLGKILQKRSVKYLGAVEVTLPNHGVCTRGVGLGEADIENSEGTFCMQIKVSSSTFHKHWSILFPQFVDLM